MTELPTDRARMILALADLDVVDPADLIEICYRVQEMPGTAVITNALQVAITASFTTDDDFDDMLHEVYHALDECDGGEDCPWAEDPDEDAAPAIRLGGTREVATALGVTSAAVNNWMNRHADMPRPVFVLAATPVFDLDAVTTWYHARQR